MNRTVQLYTLHETKNDQTTLKEVAAIARHPYYGHRLLTDDIKREVESRSVFQTWVEREEELHRGQSTSFPSPSLFTSYLE